jgi:hypothetical protein
VELGQRAEVATGYAFAAKGGDKPQSTGECIVKHGIREITIGKGEKANN